MVGSFAASESHLSQITPRRTGNREVKTVCICGNLRSTSVIKALLILQRKKPCSSVGDRNWKARQLITFIVFYCPHILWSSCIELNFHIYNRTGQSLWDMIFRYRGTAELQQSALNKVQKDPVFSQLPERCSRHCREEYTVWIQFTVCFSVGGKAARAWSTERTLFTLISSCKNTSFILWNGSKGLQTGLPLQTCLTWHENKLLLLERPEFSSGPENPLDFLLWMQ